MDWIHLSQVIRKASTFENGDKPSVFIKHLEFLEWLGDLFIHKKEFAPWQWLAS
jgi:hypothetical protein